ncbi:MAG TPA: glycosyltransferase [Acidisarcina sp.]|nr:glycosyltransferase [Acidisarcina sp.]
MPTVGLSMIVKNGGDDLRHCLASARPIVDQIVIVDTGSTDDTRTIAQEFGAMVVEYAWSNHYANARNESLKHLTTDWILVLDADEELSAEAISEIPKLLNCDAGVGGFALLQRNYMKDRFQHSLGSVSLEFKGESKRAAELKAKSYLDNPLCRLFRKHPQLYFTGRIHEGVELQLLAAHRTLTHTRLIIHHFGHLAQTKPQLEKQEKYRDILRLALEEDPNDARLWLQLGTTHQVYFQQTDEALQCYLKATELNYPKADPWISLAQICLEKDQPQNVLDAVRHLKDTGDEGILKLEYSGDALHNLGRLKEARAAYASALKMARRNPNYRATGWDGQLESKLGYTEVRLGMHRAGIRKMRASMVDFPASLPQHERLVKALVLLGRDVEAADAADNSLNHFVSEKIVARSIALNIRVNRMDRVNHALEVGMRLFPESELLRRMQSPQTNQEPRPWLMS